MKLAASGTMSQNIQHAGEGGMVGQQPPHGKGNGQQWNTDGGWLHQEQS